MHSKAGRHSDCTPLPKIVPFRVADPKETSRLLSILGCFPGSLLPPKLYLLCYKWGSLSVTVDSSWASPWWTSLLHEGQDCLSLCWACPPGTPLSETSLHFLMHLLVPNCRPVIWPELFCRCAPLTLAVTSQFWKILHSLVMTLWALCTRLVAEGATGSMQPLYLRITGAVKARSWILATLWKNAILRLSTDYAGSQKGPWPNASAGKVSWREVLLDPRLKESVVQGRKPSLMGMLGGRSSMHTETNVLILRFSALFEYPGLRLSSI